MTFVVSKINSLLALYTELKAGKGLIYIGRDGFSYVTQVSGRVQKV